VRNVRQSIYRLTPGSGRSSASTSTSSSSALWEYDYPISLDLTIHAPGGDLPAIMNHSGVMYKHQPPQPPEQKHAARLQVTFEGSSLTPSPEVLKTPRLLELWRTTFANAYAIAQAERSLWSSTLQAVLKWWFQMSLPDDTAASPRNGYTCQYKMHRAPRGYLDVLYLSPTMRITKGNRGTLVVVERTAPYPPPTILQQRRPTPS